MKKLLAGLMITLLLTIPAFADDTDAPGPVITEAHIFPHHVTAGETVYFAAEVTDPTTPPEHMFVGVFYLFEEHWIPICDLFYAPDKEVHVGSVIIPKHVPNAELTLFFVAINPAGERSRPVPQDLVIYSIRDITIALARGTLVSDDAGAVKNFHHGDDNEDKLPVSKGLTVPVGTVLLFQSIYDGVWYDFGAGHMGTTIELWVGDNTGNWELLGEDAYHSGNLEGPAIRKGRAHLRLPCMETGKYLMKVRVVSAVQPELSPRSAL